MYQASLLHKASTSLDPRPLFLEERPGIEASTKQDSSLVYIRLHYCTSLSCTLLISPLMDFLRASHDILWYATLLLSLMFFCIIRSFAGGIYAPPVRVMRGSGSSLLRFGLGSSDSLDSGGLGDRGGVCRRWRREGGDGVYLRRRLWRYGECVCEEWASSSECEGFR